MSHSQSISQWTEEEDAKLKDLVLKYGHKKWSIIAAELGTKGSKQCRRRWKNVIDNVNRTSGAWTPEEDAILLEGHRQFGNKWTEIAKRLVGRTDNAVKNRYHAIQKARGVDLGNGGIVSPGDGRLGVGHSENRKRARHDVDMNYDRMSKHRYGAVYQPGCDGVVPYPNKPNLHIVPPDEIAEAPAHAPRVRCMYGEDGYTAAERALLDEVNQMGAPLEFIPYEREDLEAKALGNVDLLEMLSTPRFFAISPTGNGNESDASKALDDSIIWLRTGLTPRPGEAPTPAQQYGQSSGPPLSPAHRHVLRKFFSSALEQRSASTDGSLPSGSAGAASLFASLPSHDIPADTTAGRGAAGIPQWPRAGTPMTSFQGSPTMNAAIIAPSPLDETAFRMLLDVLDDGVSDEHAAPLLSALDLHASPCEPASPDATSPAVGNDDDDDGDDEDADVIDGESTRQQDHSAANGVVPDQVAPRTLRREGRGRGAGALPAAKRSSATVDCHSRPSHQADAPAAGMEA